MRRTALIIASFAIIACGMGSAQADAASTSRGQAVASTPVLYGKHCEAVHSNVHGRSGTICVALARSLRTERGEVTFTASSGQLTAVSVQILELSVNNKVIESVRNTSKTVLEVGGVIPLSWWDEPTSNVSPKVGVYEACMIWTGGGKACTGPGWLYTNPVPV